MNRARSLATILAIAGGLTVLARETPLAAADAVARAPLARFTTSYAHDGAHHARAFNVELAAEAIDGKALAPGATLSFNDAVGERTAAFGFARSIVLRDGMIAEGTGGGTCQVASTLHAAAILAGLEIVERTPHSRPSAYIRMGLDATVAFPSLDLKLKNPRSDRVVVHARAGKGTLDVWLDADGPEKPAVTVTSEIVARTRFVRTIERDASVPKSTVRVKAFGIPGFRMQRTREVRSLDGRIRRDVRFDVYPPTTEILQVAPDFDVSRLVPQGPSDDEPPEPPTAPAPALVRDEAGLARPSPSQVRPSTRVVIEN